jgi:hypothetical protein
MSEMREVPSFQATSAKAVWNLGREICKLGYHRYLLDGEVKYSSDGASRQVTKNKRAMKITNFPCQILQV